MDKTITNKSVSIIAELIGRGVSIATAESCTGGGVASALTSVSGSSAVVKGGIVAYATEVKSKVLRVSRETLETQGVVSEATVLAMAKGAIKVLGSDIAVATSGVTGPTGGTEENPVCTVWIAVVNKKGEAKTLRYRDIDRGRQKNTRNAVLNALKLLDVFLKKHKN